MKKKSKTSLYNLSLTPMYYTLQCLQSIIMCFSTVSLNRSELKTMTAWQMKQQFNIYFCPYYLEIP